MTQSIVVQDTRLLDAIKIEDYESEQVVRGWLAAKGHQHVDLTELVQQHFWFLRDRSSGVVEVVRPDNFVDWYATAEEREFDKLADMLVGTVQQVLDWQYFDPTFTTDLTPEGTWFDALDEEDARNKAKAVGSDRIRSRVSLVPDWVEVMPES
jgi:hypothetical protein